MTFRETGQHALSSEQRISEPDWLHSLKTSPDAIRQGIDEMAEGYYKALDNLRPAKVTLIDRMFNYRSRIGDLCIRKSPHREAN